MLNVKGKERKLQRFALPDGDKVARHGKYAREFFDYLKKHVHVEKGQKREKKKKILLSYDEQDYLVMQIRASVKEIENLNANLKWYNLIKKLIYSSVKAQNVLLLDELLNRSSK